MYSNLKLRTPGTLEGLSRQEMLALLDSARGLKQAAEAGRPQRLLRGKNIALFCESDTDHAADAFARAAAALGAQVARIRPSDSGLVEGADLRETGRMLGLLYNAINCEGMPSSVVQALGRAAGIPVFDGLAAAGQQALGNLLSPPTHVGEASQSGNNQAASAGEPSAAEQAANRDFALQALLVAAVA